MAANLFRPDKMALDIGPTTRELFSEEISSARTIVWNGPMGEFRARRRLPKEHSAIAQAVADNPGAISIVGGGDSVSAVKKAGVADKHHPHLDGWGALHWNFSKARSSPEWRPLRISRLSRLLGILLMDRFRDQRIWCGDRPTPLDLPRDKNYVLMSQVRRS